MKLLLPLIMLSLSIPMANGQILNAYSDFGYIPKNKYISTFKGITIENKDTTENISSMVIDIEKSEILLYGNDSVVLEHISISEKDILRFLSVDPLTHQYPELTPYQFASNRPIDGIDLDGLEWTKTKTYNPQTGITNVQFQVKLKVVNDSKIFKDLNTLREEITTQFATAFKGVKDDKTVYSGSIEVTYGVKVDGDFSSTLADFQSASGGITNFTNTKVNNSSINAYNTKKGVAPNTPRDPKELAQDIIHELIHTAGPNHPDDTNQAEDIQIIRNDKTGPNGELIVDHKLGPNAKLELIIHNIMLYPRTKINGVRANEYVPNRLDMNKVSPGQSDQISNQIDKDENK